MMVDNTSIHGYMINNLRLADDIDMIDEQIKTTEEFVNTLHRAKKAVVLLQ